jgi:hypothetical protein
VQSVVADDDDMLWILDPASPMFLKVIPDGPKAALRERNARQLLRCFRDNAASHVDRHMPP